MSTQQRKNRTRTLIQLGGLVDKAGLAKLLNINPGDDLQTDLQNSEKAAVLLGILMETCDNITTKLSGNLEQYKTIGFAMLKSKGSNQ